MRYWQRSLIIIFADFQYSVGKKFIQSLVATGNQHGGHKYDDLQNWLHMTSHENLLCKQSHLFHGIGDTTHHLMGCFQTTYRYIYHHMECCFVFLFISYQFIL